MPDVLIYQTIDDGDINITNGVVELDQKGLFSAGYLSLFGGDTSWWGNLIEENEAAKFIGEFATLLEGLPAVPANIPRLQKAAERDLAWFLNVGAASSITVTVTMPGLNKVKIVIDIDGDTTLEYVENWQA